MSRLAQPRLKIIIEEGRYRGWWCCRSPHIMLGWAVGRGETMKSAYAAWDKARE